MGHHYMIRLFLLLIFIILAKTLTKPPICQNANGACLVNLESNIEKLNQNVLSNCPESCRQMHIRSSDSSAKIIDQNAFQNFNQLTLLALSLNLSTLKSFSWLSPLRNLENLNLSHCKLNSFKTIDIHSEFPDLLVVDLSYNSLNYVFVPLLPGAFQLKELNLASNRFRSFPGLMSGQVSVNIVHNLLECTCENVYLYKSGRFVAPDFHCEKPVCPFSISFFNNSRSRTLNLFVAESFQISCSVNTTSSLSMGVFSPLGFIPGPSWDSNFTTEQTAQYHYVVLPVQKPVYVTLQRTAPSALIATFDYARGHHSGIWHCAALSGSTFLVDTHAYTLAISTGVHELFLSSTTFGFIVMGLVLLIGFIIGGTRYLVETRCFRQRQKHKFVVRPLIGVIPVPAMHPQETIFVEEISLTQRICPSCLNKPTFLCGYCLSTHDFTNFEVLASSEGEPPVAPPSYNDQCTAIDASTLLRADCSPAREESDGDALHWDPTTRHANIHNYNFPSEFCHCYHLDMRFNETGEPETSTAVRDVKLIFEDEQLAKEYTEALEVLQVAAKSNDAVKFCERLQEFRSRLMHDVGARVHVARQEIVSLKERSARSVARLRDQGGAVAHFMKTGLSQVCDGMRSVAEMCTGGGGASIDLEEDGGASGLETIGQCISVVTLNKDGTTKKTTEHCLSNFSF